MTSKTVHKQSRLNEIVLFIIVWSVLYGFCHLFWLFRGTGYPFENQSLELFRAVITYLPSKTGGIVFVIICLIGLIVGTDMKKQQRMLPSWLILTYLWGTAVSLILFVPDTSLIAAMAYAFLFKFDFTWSMLNQIICIMGALSMGFAALVFQRQTRDACEYCGRATNDLKPFFLIRWGRWITYFAVLAPIPYAISRYAWALGISLGIDQKTLQDLSSMNPIHHIIEWVFGSLCIVGGLLTLGLIQKWGERFPAWFPCIGEQRVPILLAVIPATCVAIAVTSAGLVFTFSFIAIQFSLVPLPDHHILLSNIWGTVGPMLFWIPWGISLGLATLAYYYRRRGQCSQCNRE